MSGITNGDDFQRGWNEGHKAALDGKDRDYSRMGMSWKFVFHGNSALDSYTEGYKKGYEAGINEKNVVRKVELINNNGMDYNNANAQSFQRELVALENLNNFLVQCCDRIKQVNGEFRGYITIMAETGVTEEECREFRDNYYREDEANFKAIYERISNYDLPQIRTYVELICRQFQAATGSSPNVNLRTPDFNVASSTPRGANTGRNTGQQDLEVQLDAICDMMDFFVNQRDELTQTIRDYERYCNDMVNSGVPTQIVEQYIPNFAQPNVNLINKTSAHIQGEDYPQMKKLYVETASSLSVLGKSPNRTPKSM